MYLDSLKPFATRSHYYEDLKSDKYSIYYYFDNESEEIVFCLIEKDANIDFFIGEGAIFSLRISANYQQDFGNNSPIKQDLITYLHELYSSWSEEEKSSFYNKIGIDYAYFKNLSEDEIKERDKNRKLFLSFLSELPKQVINDETYKNSLRIVPTLSISKFGDEYAFFGTFKLMDARSNKTIGIFSAENLFNSFKKKAPIKNYFFNELELDDVSKEVLKICGSIHSMDDSFYYEKNRFISFENFLSFYNLFKALNPIKNLLIIKIIYSDKEFTYTQKNFTVVQLNEIKVRIDESGIPKVNGFEKEEGHIYLLQNLYLVDVGEFDEDQANLSYAEIFDNFILRFLKFDLTNTNFNYKSVKDLVKKKMIPLVRNKIDMDDKLKDEMKTYSLNINLYAELTNDEKLLLNTRFFLGKDEISRDDLVSNADYATEVLSLDNFLASFGLVETGVIEDENVIVDFLTDNFELIKDRVNVYLSDEILKVRNAPKVKFKINTTFSQDWLNLKLTSNELSPEEVNEILAKYKRKKRFIRLSNNNLVFLSKNDIDALNALEDDFGISDIKQDVEIPLYELFKVSSFADDFDIEYDEKLKTILNEIKDFKSASFLPDKHYQSVLRDYQIDAFKWLTILRKYGLSGILADDMGLGKTLETITFISSLKEEKPILIVSPKSLIYNWEHEFKIWDENIKVSVVAGTKEERINILKDLKWNEKRVFITPYDSLRIDLDCYEGGEFNLMILDEAQYIKNTHAQKTLATKSLKVKTRLVLTGTPIENSLSDLWSIFDFLMPNYLYSHDKFKKEYEDAILSQDANAENRLRARIAPFILRRVKKDVLKDLPPKIENTYVVNMSDSQRKLYDSYLINAKDLLKTKDGQKTDRFLLLRALVRLRQLCVDPSMFIENFDEISEKLDATISLIKDALNEHHKVLVFSVFTKALEHLMSLLNKENIKTYYIYGQTKAKDRLSMCERFNKEDDVKVFLISLKAGGTGLNLTGADIIVHLDPWWNVAAENQASDRAHRIGQKHTVNVIKLICRNSVEEKVLKLQEAKKNLMDKFIGEGDKGVVSLNEDDIKYLLS